MRLICPNCDAQYEVPDDVIPPEGRDVQCSECGQTWFQAHATDEPDAALLDADDEDDTPGPNEMRVPRALAERAARKIDPDVQEILREEAEREERAREAEALESQPDLGLEEPEPDERVEQARQRMARLRGEEINPKEAGSGSRRDLLPDIEEINSTLRSASDRGIPAGDLALHEHDLAPEGRPGFWTGFSLTVAIMAILLGLYLFAPQIARAVPQTDPWLSNYVARADGVRTWLNGTLLGTLEWLEHTAASQQD